MGKAIFADMGNSAENATFIWGHTQKNSYLSQIQKQSMFYLNVK